MCDGRAGPGDVLGRVLRHGQQNLTVPVLRQRHTREHGPRQVTVRVEAGVLQLAGGGGQWHASPSGVGVCGEGG